MEAEALMGLEIVVPTTEAGQVIKTSRPPNSYRTDMIDLQIPALAAS
jgi:hypothetical protein